MSLGSFNNHGVIAHNKPQQHHTMIMRLEAKGSTLEGNSLMVSIIL